MAESYPGFFRASPGYPHDNKALGKPDSTQELATGENDPQPISRR